MQVLSDIRRNNSTRSQKNRAFKNYQKPEKIHISKITCEKSQNLQILRKKISYLLKKNCRFKKQQLQNNITHL